MRKLLPLVIVLIGLRASAQPAPVFEATTNQVAAGTVGAPFYVSPRGLAGSGLGSPTNGQTAAQVKAAIDSTNSAIIQPNINSASNAVVIVPATNSLWVDFQTGNDSTGVRGSLNKKFATIQGAQGASSAGDTIHWTGILTALTNSIALTNTTLVCDSGSITFSGHVWFQNCVGNVSIIGGTFTNVLYAVFNLTGSTLLTNVTIAGVTAFGGADNIQLNAVPAGGTAIVRNNYLGSTFDACNIGGATTNFIGYVQGNTFFLTNAVASTELRAIGLGKGYMHVDGNTFTLINQGVTRCAAIYTGDSTAYGFIGGNTFMTNGSTVFTPYIDNLTYFTSTNIYVFGHPFSEANVAGTVNFLGWDGSTLPNVNGTNIQAGTINSNKLDAATVAMFGSGGVGTSYWQSDGANNITNLNSGEVIVRSGLSSTNASTGDSYTEVFGNGAGLNSSGASQGVYIGYNAGASGTNKAAGTYVGYQNGYRSTNTYASTGLGANALTLSPNCTVVTALGEESGGSSASSSQCEWVGTHSGNNSSNQSDVHAIGYWSAGDSPGCAWSIFIGDHTAYQITNRWGNLFLGDQQNEDASDTLIIDTMGGFDASHKGSNALLYGKFGTRYLNINGDVNVKSNLTVSGIASVIENSGVISGTTTTVTFTRDLQIGELTNASGVTITFAGSSPGSASFLCYSNVPITASGVQWVTTTPATVTNGVISFTRYPSGKIIGAYKESP